MTSNEALGKFMATALPSIHVMGGPEGAGRERATANIPGLRSKPVTRPVSPTAGAARRATTPDRKPSGQRRARGRGSSDANLRVLIRDSPHRSRPQRMAWLVVGRPFRGAPDGPAYRLGRLGSRSRAYLLRLMAFLHVGT